nr:ras-related protein Rab-20 isoform X2 [Vicugna pacos]
MRGPRWAPGGSDSFPVCLGSCPLPGTPGVSSVRPLGQRGVSGFLPNIADLLCTHAPGDQDVESAVTWATSVPGSSETVGFWATWREKAGREQFHGLGSMYCRGAAAVILTYDVNHAQSLLELEDRFLGLTDTARADCLFAIVGNKVDLSEDGPGESRQEGGGRPRAGRLWLLRPQGAVDQGTSHADKTVTVPRGQWHITG